ncbi:MAG: VWA domain-containing protein [Alphaproteobacteria bacterium]|nr:VWA domain-containing protein [Alphaproteobacteria bacterium]
MAGGGAGSGAGAPPATSLLGAPDGAERGRLATNVLHFARLLRRAGLPIGPGHVVDATRALALVDLADRAQVYWALAAVFLARRDQHELFEHAFRLFWRDPEAVKSAAAFGLFEDQKEMQKPPPGARRVAEAMQPEAQRPRRKEMPPEEELIRDAAMSFSERERLGRMDFETMSAADIRRAKALIRTMTLPLRDVPTRRFRRDPSGPRIDLRGTIRQSLRDGGDIVELARKRRRTRPPPLVALCDISGSMSRYSQVLLHFLHAVTNDRDRVHAFLFGTRLSNVTRQLRHRDPEVALRLVADAVPDWSGGTRIGESIARFNHAWSRRVLGQGAVVLLITDGLDRDGAAGLAEAMERLHKSCRRLIWLNPLLRYRGFEPKSLGIRTMLPHVDDFRTVHSLDSLEDLVRLLSRPMPRRRPDGAHPLPGRAA